jgi:EPS-associated MarR family transcriptional regulator
MVSVRRALPTSLSDLDTVENTGDVQAMNIPFVHFSRPGLSVADSSFLGVLRLLDSSPRRTQREMAHELGMSLGKANYLLRALLGKGFVKVHNFRNSSNKRGYAYLLTPEGVAAKAELTRHFLARKIEEYDSLRLEIERLRAESEGQSGKR